MPLGAAQQLVGVEEHRGLDRVSGGERKLVEELAPRRHLARQRLSEAGQLGIEGRQERPRRQLGDPAAVRGQLLAPPGSRTAAGTSPFTKRTPGLEQERAEHPRREVGGEAARVRVQVGDQLAAGHRQRPPHGVALAERRPELGHQLGLLVHLGAQARGQLGGAVLRGGVHHQHLVHQVRAAPAGSRRSARWCPPPRGWGAPPSRSPACAPAAAPGGTRSGGRSRINPRVLWHSVTGAPTTHPGSRCSKRAATRSSCAPPARALCPARACRSPTTSTRRCSSRSARIESLWSHQADTLEAARRGHTIVTTATASGKSLAFNLPVLDTLASDPGARALYLYPTKALAQDQARGLARMGLEVPAPGDLRRRHAEGGARRDPPPLEPHPHEPGHAPRGRAAQPPDLGRRAGQPRLGRGGRGARVPRRVRLPRGQRAPPPAAACSRLRHRAALRAHERHDRQPDGAGRAADRARLHARGPRRRAASGAADRDVEPAARERGAGPAGVGAVRGGQPARRPGAARRAHDLLPEVAPRRGADPALRPRAPRGAPAATTWPSGSLPTAPATRPPQRRELERRLAEGELLAVVATERARARASTSATSTPRCA